MTSMFVPFYVIDPIYICVRLLSELSHALFRFTSYFFTLWNGLDMSFSLQMCTEYRNSNFLGSQLDLAAAQ